MTQTTSTSAYGESKPTAGLAAPVEQALGTLHVHLGCEFRYTTLAGGEFVAIVEPPSMGDRALMVSSERSATPGAQIRIYRDGHGNRCWRMTADGPELTFRYDAVFAVPNAPDEVPADAGSTPIASLPDDVLEYTLPSRFCQSDLLNEEAWRLFAGSAEGPARVQAVCGWVHANISYGYDNSSPTTSAVDTYERRAGVCRDFAHLPVAFCRALSIPARYVFGYLPDYGVEAPDVPMDFHAWFEAYLGGRWYTFDARHNVPRIGRVKVGHGRDAVDVAMVTSYGAATLDSMTVWTDAYPAGKAVQ